MRALLIFGLSWGGVLGAFACSSSGNDVAPASFGGSSGSAGSAGTGAAGSAGASGSSAGTGGVGAEGGAGGAGGTVGGTAGAGGSSGSGGTGAGAAGAGGSGGSGGSLADREIPDVVFQYDGPGETQDACAATTVQAERMPLDMYVMLDRSGSMGSDCNFGGGTASKWCRAVNALGGYFQSPTAAGNAAALQYFPIGGYSCSGNGGSLATPAVGLGTLNGHAGALIASLNAADPNGDNTPIEAALRGLTSFTGASRRAGRTMIGILITDGDANGCSSNYTTLAQVLQAHYNATGIQTFVIGMEGATFSRLETMAAGGGAQPHTNFCGGGINPCRFYNVGNGDPSVFIAALQTIQNAALGCDYNMPQPDGGRIDLADVKVLYTPGGGSQQQIPRVPDASQCPGPGSGGWYFDNNQAPTRVTLCPATCSVLQGDANARIDLELGCLGS